jgi:branched-chain amino acid aminotransferase
MAFGKSIRTYWEGRWHKGDLAVMKAADHGIWQGSSVFDGARYFDGMCPDLALHCARINLSAEAMMITPTCEPADMVAIIREGLQSFGPGQAVYIRPMYWALHGSDLGITPMPGATGFAISLEEVAMPDPNFATRVTRTRFRRPVLEDAVCNAKAGALYPNNARMLAEAQSKGFGNALVADALGNLAESATANVFLVKDGVVFTPVPNGTFLAGITRARHISNLRADGIEVCETVLTFEDAHAADEVFLSGNFAKVTSVKEFDGTIYRSRAITDRVRRLYLDWAAGQV